MFLWFRSVNGGYAFPMTGKRLGDAIRKIADEAKRTDGKNVVIAKNVGGSGSHHSVSARQRVVQKNGKTVIHEEREERRG